MSVLAAILLWTGVGLILFCCAGVVAVRDVYARLHFVAPAGLGALAIALAILARQGTSLIADKALVTAAIVLIAGPALSHATARAAAVRRGDRPAETPDPRER